MTTLCTDPRPRLHPALMLAAAAALGGWLECAGGAEPETSVPTAAAASTATAPVSTAVEAAPPATTPAPMPAPAAEAPFTEHEITPAETEAARAAAPPATGSEASAPFTEPAEVLASRSASYAEFVRLFNEHRYEQALVPAQRVVTLSEQQSAPDDLQVALMNLGATQNLANDLSGAEASYGRVIALIVAAGVRSSPRLARAHAGLALAYHDGKRHDLAVKEFDTAIALARRTEGLFDEAQLPLIDKYTDSLTELALYERAWDAQRYGVRIVERKYGQNSAEIAPRLEVLARWYTRVGAYDAARLTLRRAIELVEDNLGRNSIELINPLCALAENYRRPLLNPSERGFETDPNPANEFNTIPGAADGNTWRMPNALAAEGQRALERALEIAESQPKPSPTRIADVRTQLGDWYQTRLQHDKALPYYESAWSAAHGVQAGERTLADVLFSRPVLLHYVRSPEWDRYERRSPEDVSPHTVELGLTVTAQGRVRDPAVLSNDGSPHMAEAALDSASTARYRPRLVDGKPLDTTDVRFAQTYFEPNPEPAEAKGADKASPTTTPVPAPTAAQPGSG